MTTDFPSPYEDLNYIQQPELVTGAVIAFNIADIKTLLQDYPFITQPWTDSGSGGDDCPDNRPNIGVLYPRG